MVEYLLSTILGKFSLSGAPEETAAAANEHELIFQKKQCSLSTEEIRENLAFAEQTKK